MAILVNGQLPGPPVYANVGDTVEFTVLNQMPFETTIHFHGITQVGTPWSDGVLGLSQWPIPPNGTFVYTWLADEYGTYFYHSHSRGQLMDGLYGPIVIKPRPGTPAPFSLISEATHDISAMEAAMENPILVTVSDWSHFTSSQMFALQESSGFDIYCQDSVLMNGKGSRYCQTPQEIQKSLTPHNKGVLKGLNTYVAATGCYPPDLPGIQGNFTHNLAAIPPDLYDVCTPSDGPEEALVVDPTNGWASINFIGATSMVTVVVSIDQHPMYIYAVDGRYIQPQLVNAVSIPNASRYSAMIKLDQPIGNYPIRAGVTNIGLQSGYAMLSYGGTTNKNTPMPFTNFGGGNVTADVVFFNDTTVVPYPPEPIGVPDATYILHAGHFNASYKWTLGGNASFDTTLENVEPFLFNPGSSLAQNPYSSIITSMGQWIDIIIVSEADFFNPPHSIHEHSNKFFVLGVGEGVFDYTSVADAAAVMPERFNLQTPQLRDTFTTLAIKTTEPTWLAIRYHVTNPGAFLLHCHFQTHHYGGFAMAMLDGIDAWPQVPSAYVTGSGT